MLVFYVLDLPLLFSPGVSKLSVHVQYNTGVLESDFSLVDFPRDTDFLRYWCRYMDRLALPSSELHLYVTPLTAHRLFAASLIIAIKFIAEKPPSIFDDRQVCCAQYRAVLHLAALSQPLGVSFYRRTFGKSLEAQSVGILQRRPLDYHKRTPTNFGYFLCYCQELQVILTDGN